MKYIPILERFKSCTWNSPFTLFFGGLIFVGKFVSVIQGGLIFGILRYLVNIMKLSSPEQTSMWTVPGRSNGRRLQAHHTSLLDPTDLYWSMHSHRANTEARKMGKSKRKRETTELYNRSPKVTFHKSHFTIWYYHHITTNQLQSFLKSKEKTVFNNVLQRQVSFSNF